MHTYELTTHALKMFKICYIVLHRTVLIIDDKHINLTMNRGRCTKIEIKARIGPKFRIDIDFSNFNTAGLDPQYTTHTKNQLPKKLKGLRQFRDHHWKALGEKNQNMF